MNKLFQALICKLRGHHYPTTLFDNFSLCHCRRCGKEVADRTFADILPTPHEDEDWDWLGLSSRDNHYD